MAAAIAMPASPLWTLGLVIAGCPDVILPPVVSGHATKEAQASKAGMHASPPGTLGQLVAQICFAAL